jgi:DNA mismatch repair protein MutL
METAERHKEALEWLGFDIEFFGDTTWVIKSVPAVISVLDPVIMLHDVLDSLHGQSSDTPTAMASVIDELLASMACKAAVKAGNRLEPSEMVDLLQQMEQSQVFSHCPHGRPVVKSFSRADLTKWFYRHGG